MEDELYQKVEKYFDKYNIETGDRTSRDYFVASLNIAEREYELSNQYLADEFHVSIGTVKRWQRGRSTPHPRIRASILERLLEIL